MDNPTDQPIKYAAYPRGPKQYGYPEHLQAVADGFFGLNVAALVSITLAIGLPIAGDSLLRIGLPWLIPTAILGAILTGYVSYAPLKRLGEAFNWRPLTSKVYAVVVGALSPMCIGFLLIAMFQSWAAGELRKYGLGGNIAGVTKRDVARKMQEFNPPLLEPIAFGEET